MSDETPLKYVQSREEFSPKRPPRDGVDPGQRFLENDREWACVTRLPGDRSSQWEGGKAWIPGAKGQQADDTGKKGTLERHEPSLRPSRLLRCVCVGDHGRTVGWSPGGESDGGVVGEGSAWWGAVAPPTRWWGGGNARLRCPRRMWLASAVIRHTSDTEQKRTAG